MSPSECLVWIWCQSGQKSNFGSSSYREWLCDLNEFSVFPNCHLPAQYAIGPPLVLDLRGQPSLGRRSQCRMASKGWGPQESSHLDLLQIHLLRHTHPSLHYPGSFPPLQNEKQDRHDGKR